MKPPTEKQLRILRFVCEYTQDHGYPPSLRDFCDEFSLSINGVTHYLISLEAKGLMERSGFARAARAVAVTRKGREVLAFTGCVRGEAHPLLVIVQAAAEHRLQKGSTR